LGKIEGLLNSSSKLSKIGEIFTEQLDMITVNITVQMKSSQNLEKLLTLDYNNVYSFLDDFQCSSGLKNDVIRIREASKILNFYTKYAIAGQPQQSMLYHKQFVDYCSGGSCLQSLQALISLFDDKNNNVLQNCDILDTLYNQGDVANSTYSVYQKGNRALIVHRSSLIVDIINQGIIIESAYVSMSSRSSNADYMTTVQTGPSTFLDDLVIPSYDAALKRIIAFAKKSLYENEGYDNAKEGLKNIVQNGKSHWKHESGVTDVFSGLPEKTSIANLSKFAQKYLSFTYPDRLWNVVVFKSSSDLSNAKSSSTSTMSIQKTKDTSYLINPASDELSFYDSNLGFMIVCISSSTKDSFALPKDSTSKKQKQKNRKDLGFLAQVTKVNEGLWSYVDATEPITAMDIYD